MIIDWSSHNGRRYRDDDLVYTTVYRAFGAVVAPSVLRIADNLVYAPGRMMNK